MLSGARALAQDFPSHPIRVIVPFAPGGPTDLLARAVGPAMSAELRQPIVIENRAGGGGSIGVDIVTKAAPDGYTIAVSGPGALVAAPFMSKVPYDATRDFAPIARLTQVNGVIVVSAQSPYKTLADLVAAARDAPGKLSFGSAGAGTLTHLAGELLNLEASIELVHVPYRGAAPASADLLGGHIQCMLPDLPGVLPQINAGVMRALAITSATRSPWLPDAPTTAEAGYPNVISNSWYGLIAPAGTPPDIQKKLYDAAIVALKGKEAADQIAAQGALVAPSSPQEFAALIAGEQTRWKRVIEATGAKME
ncbi:MAG: Bug family tripartite tricarboxylate transporter substrate binding protein [Xanthobacteraceae bacterium]